MRMLIVGGTWNLENGKKSGLIDKMYNLLKEHNEFDIDYFNGGEYEELKKLVESAKDYKVILWMANVPNELEKIRDVKNINPFAIVIGSKRNHYDYNKKDMEYTFVEILNKALLQRNNLTIQFSKLKDENVFKMLLFDPLGTSWYDGYDLNKLVENMVKRVLFISQTRRERTYKVYGNSLIVENEDFYKYVREVAEIFHKTIQHDEGVTRFLGNASFRKGAKIFVTRRDVDKALIKKDTFVESYLEDNKVYYYGDYKPSKDTVVQTRLYEKLPNINYIVHSHCYAKDGYFTSTPVPCGALDEIDKIMDVIRKYYNNDFKLNYYKINLIGHGCIIFGNSIEDLRNTTYLTRNLPEYLEDN